MSDPTPSVVIDLPQLEAEMAAGCSVTRHLDVSLTTLAHLILAAHTAMRETPPGSAIWTVLVTFASEATRLGQFPPETSKMLIDSWAGLGLKMNVQTFGQAHPPTAPAKGKTGP